MKEQEQGAWGYVVLGLAAAGGLLLVLWPKGAKADTGEPPPRTGGGGLFGGLGALLLGPIGGRLVKVGVKLASREPNVVWRWGAYNAIHDSVAALRRLSPGAQHADMVDAVVFFYVGQGRSPFADGDWLGRNAQDDYANLLGGKVLEGWIPEVGLEAWVAIPGVRRAIERGRKRWFRRKTLGFTDGRVHLPGGRYGLQTAKWTTRSRAKAEGRRPSPSDALAQFEGGGPPLSLFQPSDAGVDKILALWGMPSRSRGPGESWAAFKDRHKDRFTKSRGLYL